jgi:hypothetical protein
MGDGVLPCPIHNLPPPWAGDQGPEGLYEESTNLCLGAPLARKSLLFKEHEMSEANRELAEILPRLDDGGVYEAPDQEQFEKSLSSEERNQFYALKAIIEAFLYDDRVSLKHVHKQGAFPALNYPEMIAHYFIAWQKHGASKEVLEKVIAAMPTAMLGKMRALSEHRWGTDEERLAKLAEMD